MSFFPLSRPRFQRVARSASSNEHATPKCSIFEIEDAYVVELDAPGVDPESIDIQVDKNILSFEAKRELHAKDDFKCVYGEFASKVYQRRFDIGELINAEDIQASYENGVVALHLPKRVEAKPQKISVALN